MNSYGAGSMNTTPPEAPTSHISARWRRVSVGGAGETFGADGKRGQ